jgi:hypothetical protein
LGRPNWIVVHADCAPAYDAIARWLAAAARAEMIAEGRNPAHLDQEGLVTIARTSRVLGMLHLVPNDEHWRRVDRYPTWDIDALPSQGWVEYPAPGTARVLVHFGEGAATIHPLTAYTALNIPERHIPKSNTRDGQHIVINRIGKVSAPLVAEILTDAASAIQEQE